MRVVRLITLAVLVILSGYPAIHLSAQEDEAGIALGSPLPAVTIQDLNGQSVDLTGFIGKGPALIEFWATWCPLCRALEPRLKAAHARYGDHVRFVAVAVAVNESPASVRRHLTEHPLPYPFLWDANGNAVRAFQVPSTSYVVVLDSGRVAYTGVGADQDLDKALAKVARLP
jgi:thiol-disulfide isomerase/thioredoxin